MNRAIGLSVAVSNCSVAAAVVLILPMYAFSTSPQPPFDESQETNLQFTLAAEPP